MKTIILLILSIFLSFMEISAQNDTIYTKNKWFFGAEIGRNQINSFELDDAKNSLQAGLLAEYYFTKKWSLYMKLKYFKTGVSFYQHWSGSSSGGFGLNLFPSSTYYGTFKGQVISVPIQVKWEFNIFKKLKGNLKTGYTFNSEIKNEYLNYSSNLNPKDYKKQYGGSVTGLGVNYFLSSNFAIFLDFETYSGTTKGNDGGLFSSNKPTFNSLTNIGVKYNFKK